MNNSFKLRSAILTCLCVLFSLLVSAKSGAKHYYSFRIYHCKTEAQEQRVERYLQQAYVPALHRAGIKQVGVFKPIEQKGAERIVYVFVPFSSLDKMLRIDEKLQRDSRYLEDGKDYIEAGYQDAPYSRIENLILEAFSGMPAPAVPNLTAKKADRVYELRSYEGPTEKYFENKVDMFNEGDEVGIFKNLGFNAVFYSKVIAGSRMPNLMYMTTFNSKADRDKHWTAFGADPAWKALSAKPEYQNNVSHSDITFLYPTEYSDF